MPTPAPPRGSGSRRLIGWLAIVGLGMVAVVAALVFSGWGDPAGERPTDTSTADTATDPLISEIEQRLAEDGQPVSLSELAAAIDGAVDSLLSSAAISVRYTAMGSDAGPVEGSATVDPHRHTVTAEETTSLPGGAVVLEQRRVVDGVLYVRALVGIGDGGELWDVVPVDALPERDEDRVLVGAARAAPSLERLVSIVRAAADPSEAPSAYSGSAEELREVEASRSDTTYRLVVPVDVVRMFEPAAADADLHEDGHDDDRVAVFEFDVRDGLLAGLTAYGWLLQDTEVVGPTVVEVTYEALETSPTVEAPDPAEVRS